MLANIQCRVVKSRTKNTYQILNKRKTPEAGATPQRVRLLRGHQLSSTCLLSNWRAASYSLPFDASTLLSIDPELCRRADRLRASSLLLTPSPLLYAPCRADLSRRSFSTAIALATAGVVCRLFSLARRSHEAKAAVVCHLESTSSFFLTSIKPENDRAEHHTKEYDEIGAGIAKYDSVVRTYSNESKPHSHTYYARWG